MRRKISLAEDLYDQVVKAARADHVPVDEFVSSALSMQVASRESINSRARLFNQEEFDRALETIPDLQPEEHDRITSLPRSARVYSQVSNPQRAQQNTNFREVEADLGDSEFSTLRTPLREIDHLLRLAIKQKSVIRFRYQTKERIAEPHDYGIQNGRRRLLAYQIGGSSRGALPNWRLVDVDLISELRLLDKTFKGGRPSPSRRHKTWDQLYARVTGDKTPHRIQ